MYSKSLERERVRCQSSNGIEVPYQYTLVVGGLRRNKPILVLISLFSGYYKLVDTYFIPDVFSGKKVRSFTGTATPEQWNKMEWYVLICVIM